MATFQVKVLQPSSAGAITNTLTSMTAPTVAGAWEVIPIGSNQFEIIVQTA